MTFKRGDTVFYEGREVIIDLRLIGDLYQVSWQDTSRGGRQCENARLQDLAPLPPPTESPSAAHLTAAYDRARGIEKRLEGYKQAGQRDALDLDAPIFESALRDVFEALKALREGGE